MNTWSGRSVCIVGFVVVLVVVGVLEADVASGQSPERQQQGQANAAEPKQAQQGGQPLVLPAPPNSAPCTRKDLSVVDPPSTYGLSSKLTIRAVQGCAAKLREALAVSEPDNAITLYLNDVQMVGVRLLPLTEDEDGAVRFTFVLVRQSADSDSRAAWDRFLGAESKAGFDLTPAVGIGDDRGIAIAATTPMPLKFGVATQESIKVWLGFGVIAFLLAYAALAKHRTILCDPHGRYSLGKSQFAFWALLVLIATSILGFVTGTLEYLPPSILTLLGISAATGVVAVAIDATKRTQEQEQETELEELEMLEERRQDTTTAARTAYLTARVRQPRQAVRRRSFMKDICSDGHGLSIHRLQVVAWTGFLGCVFVAAVANRISMPDFDDSLLLLMGVSSGAYLGFKLPEPQRSQPPN